MAHYLYNMQKKLILVKRSTVESSRRFALTSWRAVRQYLLWKKTGFKFIGPIIVDLCLAWSKLCAARWWSDISPGALREKRRAFFVKILKSNRYLNTFFCIENDYELKLEKERQGHRILNVRWFFFLVIFCKFLRFSTFGICTQVERFLRVLAYNFD